jgi:hypothetical protein
MMNPEKSTGPSGLVPISVLKVGSLNSREQSELKSRIMPRSVTSLVFS